MSHVGALDQLIQIHAQTETADGMGGHVQTWAPLPVGADIWAHVETKSAGERMSNGAVAAYSGAQFTIRNHSEITARHAIKWRGRLYNIRAVHDLGPRPHYLVIEAEAGVTL